MAEQPRANRRTVLAFFRAAEQGQDIMPFLTDDITWWMPDHWQLSGTYGRAQIPKMLATVFASFAEPLRFTINHVTAEQDRVAVDCDGVGTFVDGAPYDNCYHFLFHLNRGKISQIKEFMNTAYVAGVFAGRLPAPPPSLDLQQPSQHAGVS